MKKRINTGLGPAAWLVALLIAITGLLSEAAAQTPLQTLLESKAIDREQTALYIMDLRTGETLDQYRADSPIVPASVMKCVTTAALSLTAPYSTRFATEVYLEGKKTKDEFTGRILVVGGGDPSLADNRHDGQPDFMGEITEALKRKGIARFRGEIAVDESLFTGPATPPSWAAGDLEQAYGTGCHAFNFQGNASGKKSIGNPAAVFRSRLKEAMDRAGIAFDEGEAVGGSRREMLVEYQSPALADIMRSCMFRSDNLYAETLLRHFGIRNGADGSGEGAARMAMQHWEALNFPLEGVNIVDGSGLSRSNRLTAEFLAMVLLSRHTDPQYVAFFPLTGEEGTVRRFMKDTPLEGHLALKTGSMSGIQSYAGYLLDDDYRPTHVVVVMTNGMKDRGAFREALSRYFLALFSQVAPNWAG